MIITFNYTLKLNRFRPLFTAMGAPKKADAEKKARVSLTPAKDVLAFIDSRKKSGEFASRTHGFERAVRFYRDNEKLARRQLDK